MTPISAPPPGRVHLLSGLLITGLVAVLASGALLAETVTIRPSKDTTLYGNASASLSNGGGPYLFAGSSGQGHALRGLIAFDLAGQIPSGATVNSVTLTLAITTPISANANVVRLHRLLADWGEGSVVASSGGGGGAPAAPGDATWTARMLNVANWTTPGGDFAPTISASQSVSGSSGNAVFTGAGLVADVQNWVNTPASNFGWIMMAQNESGPAVRFASSESTPLPSLQIDYDTPGTGSGNTAPVFALQPASQTAAPGTTITLSVSATGTPAPTYQWQRNGTPIPGATGAQLTLAGLSVTDAGSYTVVATNSAGTVTSNAAVVTVSAATGTVTARLTNLSVRAALAAGQTLIVGFSVNDGERPILLRGVGPTLASLGVTGAMTDPRLELYNGTTLVAENDNWGDSATLSTAFSSIGAFPFLAGSRDAAFLQSIAGTHSVHLKGTDAGVGLVELYDTGPVDNPRLPRLVNVSARNQVGTGDNILIFGFFVAGTGTENVLIRAIGPGLADLGVTGAIADPRFEVFSAGNSTPIASNDNWDPALTPIFTAVSAFPLAANSRDAALVTTLAPGAYTVQVSGVNGTTGEALVEIYEAP